MAPTEEVGVTGSPMHEGEIAIDSALVHRLLRSTFPDWADQKIQPVTPWGTDNAIFRLGERMVVRLPRVQWAAAQVEKEQRWLPCIGPLLPFPVPKPLGKGAPAEGYPWAWSVYTWLDGDAAVAGMLTDPERLARDLGVFVSALHSVPYIDGPPAGRHNFGRGAPLATRDRQTLESIDALADEIDSAAATDVWRSAVGVREWRAAPVWIHGDLQAGNLLLADGGLAAVLDFGGLALGDPACDLMVAWSLLPRSARLTYRAGLDLDNDAWLRGRGWALSVATIALAYYRDRNATIAQASRRTIAAVLED